MRLLLSLYLKPGAVVPFQYQDALLSALHKLLGRDNVLHDAPRSLYSFGPLQGLYPAHGGLATDAGIGWQLDFYDIAQAERIAQALPWGCRHEVLPGLVIIACQAGSDTAPAPGPMRVLSPVLVQDWLNPVGTTRDHLLPDHPRHAQALTTTMRRKLADAGLSDASCDVRMLPRYKTKLIQLKGLSYRCAVAPVVITGTDEQRRFARAVGVGHSTGCGFGFLQ